MSTAFKEEYQLSIQQSVSSVYPDLFQIIHHSEKKRDFPWKCISTTLAGATFIFLELYKQNWSAFLLCACITIHFDDANKSKMSLVGRLHCCFRGVGSEGTTSSQTHTYTNKQWLFGAVKHVRLTWLFLVLLISLRSYIDV